MPNDGLYDQYSTASRDDALPKLSDAELLARWWARDETSPEAFGRIVERYESRLLRYARRTIPNRDTVQELVQETFLRFIKTQKPTDTPNLGSWLYRVLRNLCIDHFRKESRMEDIKQEVGVDEADHAQPSDHLEREDTNRKVLGKLRALPDNQREVIVLKVHEGKSYREIGQITGLTVSNVGYLIHKGLKELARQLRPAEEV